MLKRILTFTLLFQIILLAGIFSPVFAKDEVSISAALSATSFSIDSTVYLTVTVHGARKANVEIPLIDNLLIHKRGQSSKMQVINGEISSSITYTFIIQPVEEGKYVIPALEVKFKNGSLKTEPLSFEVFAEQSNQSDPAVADKKRAAANELAFITVTGLKEKAYTGEIIPIEIKAYFRQGIRVEIQNLPTILGEAFVLSPLTKDPIQTTETHNGTNYSTIAWQSTISPIKEGGHDFSLNLDATLLLPQRSSRSLRKNHPLFDDDFFNSFFGGIEKKNVKLKSENNSLTVFPLPEKDKPEHFSGAIGDFAIEASAQPDNVDVGDPITLKIVISGKGNFDRVIAPLFPDAPEWKTYSPSAQFESGGNNYEGKKIFEQAIVANSSSIDAIPSLQFSFFDPQKEIYVTRKTPSLPLHIRQEPIQQSKTNIPSQTTQAKEPSENLSSKLVPAVPVQLNISKFTFEITPVFKRVWFLSVAILCTIVLLAVFLSLLLKNYRRKNKALLDKKRIDRQCATIMTALNQARQDKNGHGFIRGCRELIQLRLSAIWQIKPSSITLNDLRNRLPSTSPLIHIFVAAEQHAYGGANLAEEDMETYFSQLKNELEEME